MKHFFPPAILALSCLLAGCGSGSNNTSATASAGVTLSATSFSFGPNIAGHPLTSVVVTVTNAGTQSAPLAPAISGDANFTLATAQTTCGSALAAGTSCVIAAQYLPTAITGATAETATLSLGLTAAQSVALQGTSLALAGTIATTNNPQVALYSMVLPSAGSITVSFGPTTSYGRQTWTKAVTAAGPVSVYVAGMLANTTYHMQATMQLASGASALDADHVFTTGAQAVIPVITASTTSGMTPQPGVEQLSNFGSQAVGVVVTDLNANVLWTYYVPNIQGSDIEGAKLLPNGDYLLSIGQGSNASFFGTAPPAGIISVREVDLGGNTVKEITIDQLNTKMVAAGYNIKLQQFHHDITPLPNGHWIVLSNTSQFFPNVTGIGPSNVLGDVIIDLDANMNPVWVWNEFDHLDVNRHPYMFPDWTHTNAVVYSPDDGDLIVSMRHQNWVVKVDYKNGEGAGDILWRLGEGGDFKLVNGTDPTDWNYAQHFPSFFSTNTSGSFSLGLMDNGNDRSFPANVTCGTTGQPPCVYTTIPVFQIDEGAKTATLTFHQILPASLFSVFGGNTELLANGNIEYDLAGVTINGSYINSDIYEVTPTSTPQTVWQMQLRGSAAYRGYRIPSLYPGVQW